MSVPPPIDNHGKMFSEVLLMAEKESQRGRPRFGRAPEPKQVSFSTNVPPDLLERMIKFCDEEERSRAWLVQKAVDLYLTEKGY